MNKVGKRCYQFEDTNRPNWAGEGSRPLITEVWYPTSDGAGTTAFSFGKPEPRYQFDAIVEDAELMYQPERFPLIMLSHGTGGSALGMGWLAQQLASQGYIAVAVNHHGNNAIEPYLAHGFYLGWERATDLTVLIDKLLYEVANFKDRIDPDRIGVAGFSFGGYTAIMLAGGQCDLDHFDAFCASDERDGICDGPIEFPAGTADIEALVENDENFRTSLERHRQSFKDERVRAVFAIAPALGMAFPEASLAKVNIPVRIVVTEIDNHVPPKTNAHRFAQLIPGAELEVLAGHADHYVFLCEATAVGKRLEPINCIDHPSVNRRNIHQYVARQAGLFFKQKLQ